MRARLVAAFSAAAALFYTLALPGMVPTDERALSPLFAAHAQTPATAEAVACPLPVPKQVAAVGAFRDMVKTFRHPRCINCHGAFDPLAETHEGHLQARGSGLNPLTDILTVEQRLRFHEGCDSCHDNIPKGGTALRPTKGDPTRSVGGWMMAPKPMQWVGDDDEQLCIKLKRFEPGGGNDFIDHVDRDHGEVQFVQIAFNGDRALGDRLEGPPDPPPGGKAKLVDQARRWVQHMKAESGWVGDPECGCVTPRIKLRIKHTSEIDPGNPHHRAGFLGFSGDATFEVTLAPDPRMEPYRAQGQIAPDWERYIGEASLVRPMRVYHAKAGCRGSASQREVWEFSAEVREQNAEVTLRFGFEPSEETGSSTCTTVEPLLLSELNQITLPLEKGATRVETLSVRGGRARETLEVTVLEAGPPAR